MIRNQTDYRQIALATVLLLGSLRALAACELPVGQIVSVQGQVEVRSADSDLWIPASATHRLCAGDRVLARALARAAIVLDDDVLVRLDQNSTLTIMPPAQRADSELGLREGALHVISRFRKRFGVQTPFVNALVDGTEFTVIQDSVQGRVVVAEGRVRVHNRAGELLLLAGQSAAAGEAGAPSPIEVRPIDAIRWAIHYPPVIRLSDAQLGALAPALAARARSALALDVDGQTTAALDALGDGEALREVAALRALRASMLLSVGRVDQARPLLENVPAGADGAALHALRAIVRLTENAFGEAKEEAMSAVTADRDLAAGWIALSYARQAERDPQGALEAAAAACLAAPGDALAWARRAELALALSRIEEGRQHAARAVSLEPRVPRGNALLGFAQLLAGDLQAASARFDDALRIDANEPLAHLGRGLALIRAGSLAPGRRELEIAVILDPSNAELRSTLGRAYLEEARGKVASDQFELAKRLDPASPTPWYYGAFGKLRANDPIGAIADGQRAIELNDNRAVLRSDSLLDSDRAARNADLGRAYQQLGFEASLAQAARDSLADDPANSAAHRLMADAYGEQNGFESARLSELLQARLRAPLGGRPLDAYRLVPALPVLDGPRALSPEETSALFATGAHHFSASVLAGSQDTRGLSFTASSASEKAQVSASAYDLRSDGFGEAADVAISGQKLDVQLATSPSTAILAELSHSDRSGSNLAQRLFADAGDPDRDIVTRRDSGRLSLRYGPSADEEWLLSAAVGHVDKRQRATSSGSLPFPPFAYKYTRNDGNDVDFHDLGLQYSRISSTSSLQLGASAYRSDDRMSLTETIDPLILPLDPPSASRRTVKHDSGFANWDLRVDKRLSVLLGAEYQSYEDSLVAPVERMNAKLGIAYRPVVGTQFRAAIFQSMKGDYWREETLEPTRFNGFDQSFDDLSGTTSTRVAVAAQRRFAGGALVGAEWSRRSLSVPNLGCNSQCRSGWRELRHKVFAEVPLGSRAALAARWQYESLERENLPAPTTVLTVPVQLHTELLPLSLWVSLTSKITGTVEATRLRQKGAVFSAGLLDERQTSVWLTNLKFRYQDGLARWYIEAALRNIFDQKFAYQNTDFRDEARTPQFYPERSIYLRIGMSF